MPSELQQFVRAHFRSVLHLEILLVLARSPDRFWTADEVSDELRCAKDAAAAQLAFLGAKGLLEQQEGEPLRVRYRPQDPAADAHVQELLILHKHRFHTVVDLIYTNRAKEFANAFRLRKDGDDNDG